MATTNSTSLSLLVSQEQTFNRDLAELTLGFGVIMLVLWVPSHVQTLLSPLALLATLAPVLLRRPRLNELGLGRSGLLPSLWILPAAAVLAFISAFVARQYGFLHPLSQPGIGHVAGYVIWTVYQQFLLQDYFMPRLTRLLNANDAIVVTALLFALAHAPNWSLALACLAWGAASCLLFRRYRNLYALGLAQGLLGLTFAICMPDTMIHHLRVGLGYLTYRG